METNGLIRLLILLTCLSWAAFVGLAVRDCQNIQGVNILLVDNSRSVPPLDPRMERSEVLTVIDDILENFENRWILFGGREEIAVDQPSRFINDGMHTDFYFAFQAAVRIRQEYPPDCPVKIILITDGLLDAFVSDYPGQGLSRKAQAMEFSLDQTLKLLDENPVETYIILLGGQYDRSVMEQIVIAANGFARANPLMEKAAEFLGNDGVLLRQFIFKHEPEAGIEEVKEIVQTITTEDSPYLETFLLIGLVLLGVVALALYFRSFPAVGDQEIIEMVEGVPVLVGAEVKNPSVIANPAHFSRKRGFQYVTSTTSALASLSYQQRKLDFSSRGCKDLDKLTPIQRALLEVDLERVAARLTEMEREGRDEEIIVATDLRYYCSNLSIDQIRTIIQAREQDRSKVSALDLLHAKVYLSMAPDLMEELSEYRVLINIPSRNVVRATVEQGQEYRLDGYKVRIAEVEKDSRYSARVVMEYLAVPSLLGLKRLLPSAVQRTLRFRRPQRTPFVSEI